MKFFIDPADLNPDFDTSTGTRSAEDLTLPGSRSYYSIKQKPTPSPPDGLAGAQSPTPSAGGSGGYQYNLELLHTQPIKRANQAAGSVPPPRPELTQQYYEYMAAQSKGVNLPWAAYLLNTLYKLLPGCCFQRNLGCFLE